MVGRKFSLSRHPSTAPKPPSIFNRSRFLTRVTELSSRHLNFYRVHLLAFTFLPLIVAAIFYGSNNGNSVPFIDCLFMAFTVTGLNSTEFADITTWQQVILFFCMAVGSISFVSIIVIVIRLRFFRRKFAYMVQHDADAARRVNKIGAEEARIDGREYMPFAVPRATVFNTQSHTMVESTRPPREVDDSGPPTPNRDPDGGEKERVKKKKKKNEKLRTDMIKRVDEPVKVNQMNVTGWLSDRRAVEDEHANADGPPPMFTEEPESTTDESGLATPASVEHENVARQPAHATPGAPGRIGIVIDDSTKPDRSQLRRTRRASDTQALEVQHFKDHLPRTKTIEPFTQHLGNIVESPTSLSPSAGLAGGDAVSHFPGRRPSRLTLADPNNRSLTRTSTYHPEDAIVSGFGGFPNPVVAAAQFARSKIPALTSATTMPRTTTLQSVRSASHLTVDGRAKPVSYISFDAVVGRNSKFENLTEAQQEELGGVEYRALKILLKIVVGYWLLVWSAFSNLGMSTIDQSMIPFQDAYLLIIVVSLLILMGNTAFPIFLRLCIWILSKVVPRGSQTRETLQFLLDHPRRCFIYLFPSHQTWFLVFVLIVLNSIDWVSFLVLDIGNPEIEQIPVGTRIIDGLFQSFAVRAAGFTIVGLANVAPALQMLYVVMMYVAVYPIALSVRSSNVYEEKSLGMYDEDNESEMEAEFAKNHSATKYIGYHARKQLAFDMWWLVLGLWLLCIIERTQIVDEIKPEITIFSLMFEVSSAYGTVGLSLGTPRQNTSLAGVLRTLSKLVLCAIMIRGRHRGLPIAIDRAVLLPSELSKLGDETTLTRLTRRNSRYTFDASGGSIGVAASDTDDHHTIRQMPGGGLDAVQPETDEARAARVRQASIDSGGGGGVAGVPSPSAGLPASPPRQAHSTLPRTSVDSVRSGNGTGTLKFNEPVKPHLLSPQQDGLLSPQQEQHELTQMVKSSDESQESSSSKEAIDVSGR
ncbi:hypothetical protein OIO90_000778 [Microbotryomycetes sp. JL221]|nr:hypothetical protein OIO90_000778 [Microbotryomycetes sp. JL221]